MRWPALPYDEWKPTRDTLHMQLQVLGKIRLALSPLEPEWANVPLYVTARGLWTSTVPHPSGEVFDVDADLIEHRVAVRTGSGRVEHVDLRGPVARFYTDLMRALERADVPVEISTLPSEVPAPVAFPDDTVHTAYDGEAVTRYHRALLSAESVLRTFRARFHGKSPPVQLWWGSLDLAASLYSGRPVATPPDAGVIARLGGDEEYFCGGFWPGDERTPFPAFFAYMYPRPDGVEHVAQWDDGLGEFVLPYDDVRRSADAAGTLLEFLQETFAAVWTGEPQPTV